MPELNRTPEQVAELKGKYLVSVTAKVINGRVSLSVDQSGTVKHIGANTLTTSWYSGIVLDNILLCAEDVELMSQTCGQKPTTFTPSTYVYCLEDNICHAYALVTRRLRNSILADIAELENVGEARKAVLATMMANELDGTFKKELGL